MKSIIYQRILQTAGLVCLGMIFYSGEAQARMHYVYDNSGNRVAVEKAPDLRQENNVTGVNDIPEISSDGNIHVYPNPTTGIIHVEFQESQPDNDIQIMLYDLSGKFVAKYQGGGDKGVIDVGNQPNGVYVLKVMLNNKVSTLKIIKK